MDEVGEICSDGKVHVGTSKTVSMSLCISLFIDALIRTLHDMIVQPCQRLAKIVSIVTLFFVVVTLRSIELLLVLSTPVPTFFVVLPDTQRSS